MASASAAGGLIPWDGNAEQEDPDGGDRRVADLCRVFDADPTQQLAYRTILSELQRCQLAWHKKRGQTADDEIPVPHWWHTFVSDAVRSILVTGCFVYRRCGSRAGVPVCLVAEPGDVGVVWNSGSCRYVSSDKTRRWHVVVVEAPRRFTGRPGNAPSGGKQKKKAARVTRYECTVSGARRAEGATRQLRSLVENWRRRDDRNTEHNVFTTVSKELRQQNGSDRQWFRNVSSADSAPSRIQDIDMNFDTLVHRRAETIQRLDEITQMARGGVGKGAGGGVGSPLGNDDNDDDGSGRDMVHTEHMISDGREFAEARHLSSLPDSKLVMDELKHSILFSFGVPPQAVGKNINSERIASSNRLTEMAITTFTSYIKLLKERIGGAVRDETTTDGGYYINFSHNLSHYELDQVRLFLKLPVLKTMVSRTYGIPVEFIDGARLAAATAVDPAAGPGQTLQQRGTKRPLTAEESTNQLRKRAGVPKT